MTMAFATQDVQVPARLVVVLPDARGQIPQPYTTKEKDGKFVARWRVPATGTISEKVFDTLEEADAHSLAKFDEWVELGQIRYKSPKLKKVKVPRAKKEVAPTMQLLQSLPVVGEHLRVVGVFLDERDQATLMLRAPDGRAYAVELHGMTAV